jgi:hypothetical protein
MGKQFTESQIKEKQANKALHRRNRSLALMQDYKGKYKCKACIHGKSKNCLDQLPNGCEYYFNAASGREFQTTEKRKRQEIKNAEILLFGEIPSEMLHMRSIKTELSQNRENTKKRPHYLKSKSLKQ